MKTALKSVLLNCLFLVFPFVAEAQDIVCEKLIFSFITKSPYYNSISFEEEITDNPEENMFFHVDALLNVNDLRQDTVTLTTTVKLFSAILGPCDVKVTQMDDSSKTLLPSRVEMKYDSIAKSEVQHIKFVPKQKGKIIVSYNVIGSSMWRYQTDISTSANIGFDTYQQRQEYFYPKDIPIKAIEVQSPDCFWPLTSYNKREDGTIEDINLAFVVKEQHTIKSVQSKDIRIDVFVPDTLIQKKADFVKQKLQDLESYIDTLSAYIPPIEKHVNIVLINWANYKLRQAYGESFGNFILADLNFAAQNLFHEILHSVLPSHIKENSKGKYFIGESVITWLELFLFGEKGKELAQIAEIKGNLYDTEINHAETWDCIYTKGPAIIEHIAQEYGRKRMAESLIAFLLETQGEEIDYDCFYTYMKTKMSVTLLNKFDELIRH